MCDNIYRDGTDHIIVMRGLKVSVEYNEMEDYLRVSKFVNLADGELVSVRWMLWSIDRALDREYSEYDIQARTMALI